MKFAAKPSRLIILFICMLLITSGCSAAPTADVKLPAQNQAITDTPGSTPTDYIMPSRTPTPTRRPTPTSRYTPTVTPTPAASPTPTLAPTSAPVFNVPGIYKLNACAPTTPLGGMTYDLCVLQVEVKTDGKMVFSTSQTFHNIPSGGKFTKKSDRVNTNVYLKDNLGNRYDHLSVGGDAARQIAPANNAAIYGQYTFSPALPGATTFKLVDDNHAGAAVVGLQLVVIPVSWARVKLQWHTLTLTYDANSWEPGMTADGGSMLTLDEIPACQIQEWKTTVPQGSIKNNLTLGKITYKIYDLTNAGENFAVREYLASAGLSGAAPQNYVLFHLNIPLDNESQCLNDASEVLSKLSR